MNSIPERIGDMCHDCAVYIANDDSSHMSEDMINNVNHTLDILDEEYGDIAVSESSSTDEMYLYCCLCGYQIDDYYYYYELTGWID